VKEKKSSAKQATSNTPSTMEELLASSGTTLGSLKRGDKITARIISVGKREVLADIGAKSFGIIIGREFEAIEQLLGMLHEGDKVAAQVIIPEMESGETLISLRKTLSDKLWNDLKEARDKGIELSVSPVKSVGSGLLVDCMGLRGFIPQQQLDPKSQEFPERLVGSRMKVRVLEVDQMQNRLVLSEREVTQKEELAGKRKSLITFKTGEKVSGEITGIEKYALLLSVTKRKVTVPGMVHISEVSWERVEDLVTDYKIGQTIEAEVVNLDMQEASLVLSIKRITPDPWSDIEKKYTKDSEVVGKVVKVTGIGVFVELEKGIEGLIHISKVPTGKEYKEGDKVSITVDKLDKESRKISLAVVSTSKPIGYR
jgi:ribosomal protein S1